MFHSTLSFLIKNNQICLGIKKQKLGKGKYNGFGGKQESGETIEQAAIRELKEESGVIAQHQQKVGEITYRFPSSPEWDQVVHIFLVSHWAGEPKETSEMGCEWFSFDQIPFENMWDNDKHWLPMILQGKKIRGTVVHAKDANTTHQLELNEIPYFS